MKAVPIEIEIDGSHNENLRFRPLQRSIRGRFDLNRVAEPMARLKSAELPLPIPGQRLGIDPDGTGFIAEPLHDDAHAPIRERAAKAGMTLEPAVQEFPGIDLATWYFWLAKAVESGIAKVVKGKLPEKIDGEPKRNFLFADPKPSPVDKLTAAIERQSVLFEKLLAKLGNN